MSCPIGCMTGRNGGRMPFAKLLMPTSDMSEDLRDIIHRQDPFAGEKKSVVVGFTSLKFAYPLDKPVEDLIPRHLLPSWYAVTREE